MGGLLGRTTCREQRAENVVGSACCRRCHQVAARERIQYPRAIGQFAVQHQQHLHRALRARLGQFWPFDLRELGVEESDQQFVAAGVMPVDRHRRHAEAGTQCPHAERRRTIVTDECTSDLQDLPARKRRITCRPRFPVPCHWPSL